MIRYSLLALAVCTIIAYASRDWYKSLCALIAMLAVLERYDMPRAMFGIPGINPWNIMMAFILLFWFLNRKREGLRWDMSPGLNFLLITYLGVVLIGFARMTTDFEPVVQYFAITQQSLPTIEGKFIDRFINGVKYVTPGLLLYHGCNSKSRFNLALAAILVATFALGLQIIRVMPLTLLTDAEAMASRALRVLDRDIGFHRIDLAALMAGGTWSFIIARPHLPKSWRLAMLGAGALMLLALALTGGRMGYVTWFALALLIGAYRWKRYLLLAPVILAIVVSVVPAAKERMLEGFGRGAENPLGMSGEVDLNTITSDRTLIWPVLLEKISERPFFGYGMEGFFRSGASYQLIDEFGAAGAFPHPHNAYLELFLDNGLVLGLPVLLFFAITLRRSLSLFKDRVSTTCVVAGGMCFLYVGAQLIASFGSQSFYPRSGVMLMWCTIGLMHRVYRERERARAASNAMTAQAVSEDQQWQISIPSPRKAPGRRRGPGLAPRPVLRQRR